MNNCRIWVLAAGLTLTGLAHGYGIGLMPLHEFADQAHKDFGRNISLQGTPRQVARMRRWIAQIASIPRGRETLTAISRTRHKLMIFHSRHSMISAGKASAPLSANLINGRGESVDIYFNFNIPDSGSHRVMDTHSSPIEYTAIQNLYHELAHAMHMMQGSWRYARSELQAIEEENRFRRQWAEINGSPVFERVFVRGSPICPDTRDGLDASWQQEIICF